MKMNITATTATIAATETTSTTLTTTTTNHYPPVGFIPVTGEMPVKLSFIRTAAGSAGVAADVAVADVAVADVAVAASPFKLFCNAAALRRPTGTLFLASEGPSAVFAGDELNRASSSNGFTFL